MSSRPNAGVHSRKLLLPGRRPAVARPALSQAILDLPGGGVCAICAAPGYGATSALANAMRAASCEVAWVSIDPEDDPATLWRHIFAALGGKDRPHRLVDSSDRADLVSLVCRELGDGRQRWLVLDGLSATQHSAWMPDLELIVRALPGTARLALTSDEQLGAALRSARNSGRLREFDESDLALSEDESVELVLQAVPGMDVERVSELASLAQGWPAALNVAAAHAIRQGDADVTTWLRGPGLDRLFGDWFPTLPAASRDFLLDTAFLDLLTPGLCDVVRQATDSPDLLAGLVAKHAHLAEVNPKELPSSWPAGQRWWRRHGLFTHFLRGRAPAGPDLMARHSSAADWFRVRDCPTEVLTHLAAAGRTVEAGEYLREREGDLFAGGRADQALHLYQLLPTDSLGVRVERLLRVGWGRTLTGDLRGADLALAQLQAELDGAAAAADPPGDGLQLQVAAECDVLRAYLAGFHGDPATMIAAAQRALLAFGGQTRANSHQLAPILLARGQLWSGRTDSAINTLQAVGSRAFATDLIRESTLAGLIAACEVQAGHIHRARHRAESGLAWLRSQGLTPLEIGQYGVVLARALALIDAGQLDQAQPEIAAVAQASRRLGHVGDQVQALLAAARVHYLRDEHREALERIHSARVALHRSAPGSTMSVLLTQAEAAIRIGAGDAPRAEHLIRVLPAGEDRSLLWARAQLQRNNSAARRTLEAMHPTTPRNAAHRHVMLAAATMGQSRRLAEGHLARAAAIAWQEGLATLLCGYPTEVTELAASSAQAQVDDAMAWLVQVSRSIQASSSQSGATTIHPLSSGELQLVAMLPGRDTTSDIADKLGVSVNTIKTRLRRLYAKLGVHNRKEATERAAQLGLLPETEAKWK